MTDMTDAPTNAAAHAVPAPLDPKDARTIIIGLMMVMLLAALDQTIVATAIRTMPVNVFNRLASIHASGLSARRWKRASTIF